MTDDLSQRVRAAIRDVPDFPRPGILFKDITPLLANVALLRDVIDGMAEPFRGRSVTHVVAVESRGFLFGAPIALALGAALVPARKRGKLPWKTRSSQYDLEYRTDTLEIHVDALGVDDRALIVDDVLATGGTADAVVRLVHEVGAAPIGLSVLLELVFLEGRGRLAGLPVHSLASY